MELRLFADCRVVTNKIFKMPMCFDPLSFPNEIEKESDKDGNRESKRERERERK